MFDVAYRHQQALDPSALTTLPAALHAIGRAIDDCRYAGLDAASDPAVVLLARHLASVCAGKPADDVLERACTDRIAAIRRFPPLLSLAIRGVAYDAIAKERFHVDGRKALRRLAEALGLERGACEIRSVPGPAGVSGEIVLRTADIHVELIVGGPREGREVAYRRVRYHAGNGALRRHHAAMADLLAPDALAARIRRDLDLAAPLPAGLVASPDAMPALLSA